MLDLEGIVMDKKDRGMINYLLNYRSVEKPNKNKNPKFEPDICLLCPHAVYCNNIDGCKELDGN